MAFEKPFLCGLQSINPLNESLSVPTTANSFWNSNWTNQPLIYNSTAENIPQQTNGMRFMRSDVSNIVCNCKDMYEKHIFGK